MTDLVETMQEPLDQAGESTINSRVALDRPV